MRKILIFDFDGVFALNPHQVREWIFEHYPEFWLLERSYYEIIVAYLKIWTAKNHNVI